MIDVEIRDSLIDFAVELMDSRTPDGSWHESHPTLQSVIVTCQVTTWLTTVEGDLAAEAVSESCRWLCRAETVAQDSAYWRLMPLIDAGADPAVIDAAQDQVRKAVEENVIHHRNSPLHGFYVDALNRRGVTDDTYDRIVAEWLHDFEQPALEWAPPRIGHALCCIAANPAPFGGYDVARLVAHLKIGGTIDGTLRYWGSLVETAYVVKNLATAAEHLDGELQRECIDMVTEGARYLCTAWTRGEFVSLPIAGGDFAGTPYNRVLVARALSAACDLLHPGWQSRAWANEFATYRRAAATLAPADGAFADKALLALLERHWRAVLAGASALAGVAAIAIVVLLLGLDPVPTWTISTGIAALASIGVARALLGPERYTKPLRWIAGAVAFMASVAAIASLLLGEDPKPAPPGDDVVQPEASR